MATHEDDRAAYLAGEDRRSLGPEERAELDELRGLLGSTAAWAEPSADLEDRVVTAIAQEAAARPASLHVRRAPLLRPRWRWRLSRAAFAFGGLAAAAAVAVIAIVLATSGTDMQLLAQILQQLLAAAATRHGRLGDAARARCERLGHVDQDRIRLAHRARSKRIAAPCRRALLRGVAEEQDRRPGACRDLQ